MGPPLYLGPNQGSNIQAHYRIQAGPTHQPNGAQHSSQIRLDAASPNSLVSLPRACQQAIFPAYRAAKEAAQRPQACFSLFSRKPTCIERLAMLLAAPVKHVAPLCAQAPRFLSCKGTRTSGQHVTSSEPDQLPMSLPTAWPPCNGLLVTPTDQSLNDLQSQPTPRF